MIGEVPPGSGFWWDFSMALGFAGMNMLFWALMASGQITMRRVDGWQTLAQAPTGQPLGRAA